MALTSIALALTVDVRVSDMAGVRTELPADVGAWHGYELRFCQSPSCQKEFSAAALTNRLVCPECGGKLAGMTFLESRLLPADTVLTKMRYTNAAGRMLFASIVLSGRERASIHRPEVCLVGAGSEIVNQSILRVPMDGRAPLDVKVLDMIHRSGAAGQEPTIYHTFYAYWFVGRGRETPEHWRRMLWMATDRVFHNISHRWAYISVGGGRQETDDDHLAVTSAFIHDLYPKILLDPNAPAPAVAAAPAP